jgi:predicted transcriptional regulator
VSKYLKTKLGAEAVEPVLNLMEKIWPESKKFEGKDVNKLIHAMANNALGSKAKVKALKHEIVIAPKKKLVELKKAHVYALNHEIKKLEQEIA